MTKQCIGVPKHTSLSSFCMHSGNEMLQNTPKHHFGSNGGYWVCSCENVRQNIGTPKQCILYRNAPVSHRFIFIRVVRCSKTLPNMIFCLMEANGCVRAETFVGTSVPQNSASFTKRHYFLLFCMHSGNEMLQNTPKHHFGSNGGYWVCSCENV